MAERTESDAEVLRLLQELDIQMANNRCEAMLALNNTIVSKLKEVAGAGWPLKVNNETIKNLFALRSRMMARIMSEAGNESSESMMELAVGAHRQRQIVTEAEEEASRIVRDAKDSAIAPNN